MIMPSLQDQLKEEAYWLWQVHPPKRYEEDFPMGQYVSDPIKS
jgi:hypothetical protein